MTAISDLLQVKTGFGDVAALLAAINSGSAYTTVDATDDITTTSGTLADMTSTSLSVTTGANDWVILFLNTKFSHSVESATCNFSLIRNSTSLVNSGALQPAISSTAGVSQECVLFYVDKPGAGTHTYKGQWATNASTAYSDRRRLSAFKLALPDS